MPHLMRFSGSVAHLQIERTDAFHNVLRFALGERPIVFAASASDAVELVEGLSVTVLVDATTATGNAELRAVAVRNESNAHLYRATRAKAESYWRNLPWALGGVALGYVIPVLWTHRALDSWQLAMIALWLALVAANVIVLLRQRNRERALNQLVFTALAASN